MRSTLKKMGVSETEFFRQCNTSFKQGAKFCAVDHRRSASDFYYHPLVLPEGFPEPRSGAVLDEIFRRA